MKQPIHMIAGVSAERVFFEGVKVKTWIFDPPYNIGFEYDAVKDNLPFSEYAEVIAKSCRNMFNQSCENANMFMINYSEVSARLLPIIESEGWELKQWISWVYNSGKGHSKNKFTRSHRAILWFVKGDPCTYIKNCQRQYVNKKDSRTKERIKAGGRSANLYDWWNIQLVKAKSMEYQGYSNQIPEELIKNCVLVTTKKGDIVGDIMAGSGSTMQVALTYDRECVISDINYKALDFWERRLNNQLFFPKKTLFSKEFLQ